MKTRNFDYVSPVIKREAGSSLMLGKRNTCSLMRYLKSVCILKVLYITVIMHQGMPLAQLLTFSQHSSREQGTDATGDAEGVRKLEECVFTKRKQSFLRKSSTTGLRTFMFLLLVLSQFPSLQPDSGSRDHQEHI